MPAAIYQSDDALKYSIRISTAKLALQTTLVTPPAGSNISVYAGKSNRRYGKRARYALLTVGNGAIIGTTVAYARIPILNPIDEPDWADGTTHTYKGLTWTSRGVTAEDTD